MEVERAGVAADLSVRQFMHPLSLGPILSCVVTVYAPAGNITGWGISS